MEYHIPATLSGAAIAEPLQLDPKHDGYFVYIVELIRCYSLCFVSYALTSFLLIEIHSVIVDKKDACAMSLLASQYACVFLFEAHMFGMLIETADLLTLIIYATPPVTSRILSDASDHGAVMVNSKQGTLAKVMAKFRHPPPPDMPAWNYEGINLKYKTWSVVAIVMPKFILTVILGYLGGHYILLHDSIEDLVLNALAVTFILDVNTILYSCFISIATKQALEHMEAVEVEASNNRRFIHWFISAVIYPFVVGFSTFYLVSIDAQCHVEDLPPPLSMLTALPRLQTFLITNIGEAE